MAEVARREGLFDWLAALATSHANGSASRLFLLIYIVGAIVTIFLSNDATAVVLTPAVAAAVKAARAEQPLPYLLICAFIANAASFVLPISNPANLVIYGDHMPPLLQWLPRYLLPSVLSITATYLVLRLTQRRRSARPWPRMWRCRSSPAAARPRLRGIAATAVVLLAASALDIHLGLPTCLAGLATAVIVLVRERINRGAYCKDISWGVLPLVAGLFVLVEALDKTGSSADWRAASSKRLRSRMPGRHGPPGRCGHGQQSDEQPSGRFDRRQRRAERMHAADHIVRAVLIGVDLGPNLSVTGSLATILWLTALRREGLTVGASAHS